MSEKSRPFYHARLGYQTMLLGGFALFASTLIVIADISTGDDILLRQKEDLMSSLSQVIPTELFDNDPIEDVLELEYPGIDVRKQQIRIYRARLGKQVSAIAYEVSDSGYSATIVLVMAVDANGEILGVRTVTHAETPGLGDAIEVEKSDWITRFKGHSLHNTTQKQWAVTKDGGDFDQFTGATITPRTVVGAVYKGLQFSQQKHVELFDRVTEKVSPALIPPPTPAAKAAVVVDAIPTAETSEEQTNGQ